MKYLLSRDATYHGVTLTVSASLTFIKAGAQYLRVAYGAQGIEALVLLTVYQEDPNENIPVEIYRGRVDFTSYQSSEEGVQVKFQEGGLTTTFLTRDTTAVDLLSTKSLSGLSLQALPLVKVPLHSQAIYQDYRAERPLSATPLVSPSSFITDGQSRFQIVYFGLGEPVADQLKIGQLAHGPVAGDTPLPFYTATTNGPHTFDFYLDTFLRVNQGESTPIFVDATFEHIKGSYYFGVNGQETTLDSFEQDVDKDDDFTRSAILTFKETVNLRAGDKVYLYARINVSDITYDQLGGGSYSFEINDTINPGSRFAINASTTTTTTGGVGVLVHEAFSRITEAIADRPAFYSEYFGRTDSIPQYAVDGNGSLTFLTGAFQLRGFPLPLETITLPENGVDPRKSLYASFRDLYDSENARHCLGCGIERRDGVEVLRVEPRSFFYQNKVTLKLTEVSDIVISSYSEIQYNSAEVGYSKWQSGSANGLDEFNSKRTYALPLTAVKSTYNIVSKYLAAGYLIEEVRRQRYSAGTTEEGQADADNFLISLRRTTDGFAPEQGEAFSRVEGIYSPATAYNLRYAPARNFRRHGAWVRAGLVKQADKVIRLGAVEGNDKLISQLAAETVAINEHSDIAIKELATPYAQAETYNFTAILRPDQVLALIKQPYGLVSFDNGKAGYLLRAEVEPGLKAKTSITLLRAYQEGGKG